MRRTALLAVFTVVPALAQLRQAPPPAAAPAAPATISAKAAPAAVAVERAPAPVQSLGAMERELDGRLSATGAANNDPCLVLGLTRGLYINGFGVVYTAEVDLVNSPSVGLFRASITPEEKVQLHKRKLAHVALVQQTMRDMLLSVAASPSLKLAESDQIVVAVRLVYRPWEDITGLPGQIVMRADRRGGSLKVEQQ